MRSAHNKGGWLGLGFLFHGACDYFAKQLRVTFPYKMLSQQQAAQQITQQGSIN